MNRNQKKGRSRPAWGQTLAALTAASLLAWSCTSLAEEKLFAAAPARLPGVQDEFQTAGFWISRLPQPDKVLLDAAGVAAWNEKIRHAGLVRRLDDPTGLTGPQLAKDWADSLKWFEGMGFYRRSGQQAQAEFFRPLAAACGTPARELDLGYGVVAQKASLRGLPTTEELFDAPGDWFTDNLFYSALEAGTPVLILHTAPGGRWLYVQTELVAGWLDAGVVARTPQAEFLALYQDPNLIRSRVPRADVWADSAMTRHLGTLRMGAKLPAGTPSPGLPGGPVAVQWPLRLPDGRLAWQPAWIENENVSLTPLPLTQRTLLNLAFRQLNSPYGWAGMFGDQDCSQFLVEVFSTCGLILPRNSTRQAKVGTEVPGFRADLVPADKARVLAAGGLPGATLLKLPGHITLLVGTLEGQPWVIHSTWGYRDTIKGEEVTRLINRVAVSNLELGAGSRKGSHLSRLQAAVVIGKL